MQSCPDTVPPSSLAPPVRALFEAQHAALDTLRADHAALTERNRHLERQDRATVLEEKAGGRTKTKQRMLHGYEGRRRFKVFALGRVADWRVTYRTDEDELRAYVITMLEDNIREVRTGGTSIGDFAVSREGSDGERVL